jgi:hypothetical protein
MNVSEAVQVFVLIYVLVMVGLYLSSRFWLPLLTKLKRSLGLSAPVSAVNPPPIPGDGSGSLSYSFRPGAPRPPRLRKPPLLGSDSPDDRLAYCRRLSLGTRLVAYIASANPTGFPIGLFREWHEARWETYCDDSAIGSEQAISDALGMAIEDDVGFAAVVAEFGVASSYAEMADLVHFCGEAFIASKAGSTVHARISSLAESLAVAVSSDSSDPASMDEHDRMQLERKLEVDFLPEVSAKVAHLRRMHVFFRGRLIGLRDDSSSERRLERMADCRRHMEDHEKLLHSFGVSV